MARRQIRLGDSDDIPVTFQGDAVQEFVVFRDTGTVTVTTTDCSLYAFVDGVQFTKVPRNTTRSYPIQAGSTFDVQVAGTTDAQPNGSVHYSFA